MYHADQLALRTNLKLQTCIDLLGNGWSYIEELNKPSRWESPKASLVKEAVVRNIPGVLGSSTFELRED